jgi:hypothetical protein
LISLLDVLVSVIPSWEFLRPQLQDLNAYSVSIRYPGESADKTVAKEAVSLATAIRAEARKILGLRR